jgi:penicillin-binding protein 1A
MQRIKRIFLMACLAVLIAAAGFITAVYFGAFGHLQTSQELLSYKNATASVVLSEDGELLGKYFSENRTNVRYDQLPSYLINALIATEDARFFRHKGFDTRSIFRVVIKTIIMNRKTGGGSTITQQLAKNMYGRSVYGILSMPVIKIKEIILAKRLEKIFSKEDILLLYLNTVSFGENVFGIEAAARRFFNKKVEELNIQESAVLIGLLKANNYYNPRLYPEHAIKRRNVVLSQMLKYEYLEPREADSLSALPLVQNYLNYEIKGPADYFLYQVKKEAEAILLNINMDSGEKWNIEEDGLVIKTTLNLPLQIYANKAFESHLGIMQGKLDLQYDSKQGKVEAKAVAEKEMQRMNLSQRAGLPSFQEYKSGDSSLTRIITVRDSMIQAVKVLQAGLMAMDPVSGKIKAWVGGIDFRTQPYDQVLARRQLASTFKPVIYAAALERGFRPCDYFENDSITDSGIEGWSPSNFDHSYGGRYSLAGALIHSMNVPTYNVYMNVGFEKVDSLWKDMGFTFPLDNVPSISMGTPEGSIREVAVAYSSFANGGFRIKPYDIESIETSDGKTLWKNDFLQDTLRIVSKNTASLLSAILRKAVLQGTGSALGQTYNINIPLAGKTGTSQDYADAWFSVFNPSLVMVCRVGASSPAIHFNSGSNGSGSALALPLIGLTLKEVQKDKDLNNRLFSIFNELPPELSDELGCLDYKEKSFLDHVIEFFKGKDNKPVRNDEIRKNNYSKLELKPKPKRRSFFRRLFGRD